MNAENTDKMASWRHIGERTRRQLEELDALLERMLALPPFDLSEERIASPQSLTSPSSPTRLAEVAAPVSGQEATADPSSKFAASEAGGQAADAPAAESAKGVAARTSPVTPDNVPGQGSFASSRGTTSAQPTSRVESPSQPEKTSTTAKEESTAPVRTSDTETPGAGLKTSVGSVPSAEALAPAPAKSVRPGAESSPPVSARTAAPAQHSPASGERTVNDSPSAREVSSERTAEAAGPERSSSQSRAADPTSPAGISAGTNPAQPGPGPEQPSRENRKGPAWLLREDDSGTDSPAQSATGRSSEPDSSNREPSNTPTDVPQQLRWLKSARRIPGQALHWLFTSPTGSNLLGWIGIVLLLGSAAFWLGAWLGWHW